MNKQTQKRGLLKDLPQFSSRGEEIYQKLTGLQKHDERIKLFARRIARAITNFDAGTYGRRGPLEQFVLFGTPFSPIELLVKTVADMWVGKPFDGSLPYLHIDCSSFRMPDRRVLDPLIGSVVPGQQSTPGMFQFIHMPNFRARSNDLRWLENWTEWFNKKATPELLSLLRHNFNAYQNVQEKFFNLVQKERHRIEEEERKENGPFQSIIFLDRIFDSAYPIHSPLHEIIFHILGNGTYMLPTGVRVDFSKSIVIASIYNEMLYRNVIGFHTGRIPHSHNADYHAVQKELFSMNPSLMQKFGRKNIIIVNERTRESQKERVTMELQAIREEYKKKDIYIEWSDAFLEGFVDDTKEIIDESNHKVFTDERISYSIGRYIIHPISRLIGAQKIIRGATVLFEKKKGTKKFDIEARSVHNESDDIITSEHMREYKNQFNENRDAWPDWLKNLDKNAETLF